MGGYTREEAFLNYLGTTSFLNMWSWPNLFRDQGDVDKEGDGKEICDLTVIFGNNVLLFSDKRISFNTEKGVKVAWSRWARKAIGDSIKQIIGARRWLTKYPERVFLDKNCNKKIPINLPDSEEAAFHNIVVCHGIEAILSKFNTESSFIIDNSVQGEAHWDPQTAKPFHIGQIFEGDFVHVFNEATIALVLNEFDTAKDFISYLEQREEMLTSNKSIQCRSEADIIQLYYRNYNPVANKRIILSEELSGADHIIIDFGGIESLHKNRSFVEKKQEDKVSYFWDDLIESFSFHILNNSTEHKNWENPSEVEPQIRYLASTSRFERRVLANSFIEFYNKAVPGQRGTRVGFSPLKQNHAYLFFVLPDTGEQSQDQYRDLRRQMLQDYCAINKYLNPSIENIVGIACETRKGDAQLDRRFFSEGQDIVFMDLTDWREEDISQAKTIHDEYIAAGLLAKRTPFRETAFEFPEPSGIFRQMQQMKGRDRNAPCICGSGNKYKKCCGRP